MSDRAHATTHTTGPGYRAGVVQNVFIVVWDRVLPEAMPGLLAAARQACAAAPKSLVYLAVIPDGSEQPSEAGRAALADATKHLLEIFVSMHCAIEGTGFKKSIIRGIATGIFLLSGKRGKMHVHDSVADALSAAPGVPKVNAAAILEEARRRGLLT